MKKCIFALLLSLAVIFSVRNMVTIVTPVYCDDEEQVTATPAASSGDELAKNLETTLEDTKDKLAKGSVTVSIIMLILCGLGLAFFKDSRKVELIFRRIAFIIGGFLIIQVASKGWITNYATELANKYF